jgi:hypothetical protein
MKKFKNALSVSGSINHLEAFKKDLLNLGYKEDTDPGFDLNNRNKYCNINRSANGGPGNGEFGFYCFKWSCRTHLDLPQDWQKALDLAAEVEKPEFKSGDYVVFINKSGCRITAEIGALALVNENRDYLDVKWLCSKACSQHDGGYYHEDFRLATHEEIEATLIEEAKKKGFVVGAKIKTGKGYPESGTIEGFQLITTANGSGLTMDFFVKNGIHLAVKFNGVCLIPVEQCILTNIPIIKVNGYEAKFEDWGLDFNGCAKINKDAFIEAQDFITKVNSLSMMNRTVTSIKIGKGEFSPAQIEEIVKYYQEKEGK